MKAINMTRPQAPISTFFVFLTILGIGLAANADNQSDKDKAALEQFPEIKQTVEGIAPVLKEVARDHEEKSVDKATDNNANVTSRDRPADSPISSPAHDRGAIDVTTDNMSKDAKGISKEVGEGYITIHEKPGEKSDTHEIYYNGEKVKESEKPKRATGEHIHVQPEFNKRIHNAVSEPKKTDSDTEAKAPQKNQPTVDLKAKTNPPKPASEPKGVDRSRPADVSRPHGDGPRRDFDHERRDIHEHMERHEPIDGDRFDRAREILDHTS